ncbi:Calx-beta domain-containing protein [Actinoplanes sp. NBRC 103695]|uniref:Calx-beta domain-containing protein n=1 Tax=Actinoplanes sp. NBRC 103695 TaxID=3032202 RepID=UPI0024A07CA6|nr:Calx-beta domain-containing protein [Actinoplanes sp. NBRC 103695]GLY94295.1 hypothetical protein Acsp02_15510 [Actinoplanes sp. NBRC 103695]
MHFLPGTQRSLRLTLAAATAALIGFIPVLTVATPAYADPGDIDFTSDQESVESDAFVFELIREAGGPGSPKLDLEYLTVDGTAEAGKDYTGIPLTTTSFPANSTRAVTKKITVQGLTDDLDEDDETFTLRITGAGGGAPVVEAQGILDDDDATPTYALSVPDPVTENAGSARITATLSHVSGRNVTISAPSSDDTAVQPDDYTASPGVITVTAGSLTGYKDVPIIDDTRDEEDLEFFKVTGATGSNGEQRTGSVLQVNIGDNDVMPTLDIAAPGAVTEGGQLDFTVSLSAPSNRTVTVLASTEAGTATSADFTPFSNQPVIFMPGSTSETVSVQTTLDALNELDPEAFKLKLSSPAPALPVHYTAGTLEATGSVTDDDVLPVVSLTPPTVAEGDSGTSSKTMTVALDNPSGREVKVGYTVQSGTATEGEDFEAVTPGELTFAAGEQSKTFVVKVKGDVKDEPNETLTVTLSNTGGTASLAPSAAHTVTINDDDAKPTLDTFPNLTVDEGNTAVGKSIQVALSNPSSQTITLDVTATDGTALVDGSGPGSNDFDAPNSTVTILPGDTTATVLFQVNGDDVYEGDEDATIEVATQMDDNAVTAGDKTSTLTLTNDDSKPSVVLSVESGKKEGQTAAVSATVTGVSQDAITIGLTAAGDSVSGSDAAQSQDFDASNLTSTVSLAGGAVSNPRPLGTIDLLTDFIDENPQTVKISLTGIPAVAPIWLTIGDGDEDMLPTIVPAASPVQHDEADGAVNIPVDLDFTQNGNLATSTERNITAAWSTADGTAEKPADYTSTPGTVTFNAGVTTAQIPVSIEQDNRYELTETFAVQLSSPSPSDTPIAPAGVTVEIADDDSGQKPVLNGLGAPAQAFREGTVGYADFSVQLDRAASEDVAVRVWITDGTAKHGDLTPGNDDFLMPTTPVTVLAGQDKVTVPVTIKDDTVFETSETATVHVEVAADENDAVDAMSPVTASLSIVDDDPMPAVTLSSVTMGEGTGPQNIVGTVAGQTQDPITVTLAAAGAVNAGSNPAEPEDFDASGLGAQAIPGGNIPGGTVDLGTISFLDDQADEYDETAKVTMTGLTSTVTAWQTITDNADDKPPAVAVDPTATVVENAGNALVPASLDFTDSDDATSSQRIVTAVYATANGAARATSDYTAAQTGATVTFAAGDTTKNILIPITNDLFFERDETFTVTISDPLPTGATLGNDVSTVTITDDDDSRKPTFSVADVAFTEGASGGDAVFTVALSKVTTQAVEFDVTIVDDTATHGSNMTGPGQNDFTEPSATVTVPAGSDHVDFSVPVANDTAYEGEEEATLTVERASGEDDATGSADSSDLVITDDDAKPSVELTATSGTEGSDLTIRAVVTGVAQRDFPFDLAFAGYSTEGVDPAESIDYTDNGLSGVIPGGYNPTRPLSLGTVTLEQDQIDEPAEFFRITATDHDDPDRYVSSVYKINDDQNDLPPSIAIDEVTTIDEGEESVDVRVALMFDGANDATSTEQDLSVGWKTTDGTAKAGYDYTTQDEVLDFPAGVTEAMASVPIEDDGVEEPTQSFSITLSGAMPKGIVIDEGTGQVQITDDDAAVAPTLLTSPANSRPGPGLVTVYGQTREGAQVRVYAAAPSTPTKWFSAATTTADIEGQYSVAVPFDMGYWLQARVIGSGNSTPKLVKVSLLPTFTATSTVAGTVNFAVGSSPKLNGLSVTIQRQNANGSWSAVARGVTAGTARTYVFRLTGQRSRTKMTFRAVLADNAAYGVTAGTSTNRVVTIR